MEPLPEFEPDDPVEGFVRGKLLIAAPSLTDPNFWRSVVLVAEHSEEGAMGLVLNRPLDVLVAEAVEPLAPLVDGDAAVFQGGPVEPQAVLALAEFDDPTEAVSLAIDGVGFVSSDPDIDALRDSVRRARVFAGYAGWSPGQLEEELAEEAWLVEPAQPADIFADDASELWASVLRRRGVLGTMLAMMPPDPSMN